RLAPPETRTTTGLHPALRHGLGSFAAFFNRSTAPFSFGRSLGVSRPMSEYWNAPSLAHDTTSEISRFDTPASRRARDKTSLRNWLNSATEAGPLPALFAAVEASARGCAWPAAPDGSPPRPLE